MKVYENLRIIDLIKERIYMVLTKYDCAANVINGYTVTFYLDEKEERKIPGVGIRFKFHDSDVPTMLNILEEIKQLTGADDIFFHANEGDYIEEIELYFYEEAAQDE